MTLLETGLKPSFFALPGFSPQTAAENPIFRTAWSQAIAATEKTQ